MGIVVPPLARTFHPTLTLALTPPQPTSFTPIHTSPDSTCHAILRLALPDAVFIDPDELDGRWGSRGLIQTHLDDHHNGGSVALASKESEESGRSWTGRVGWDMEPANIDIERPVRPSKVARDTGVEEVGDREESVLWLVMPFRPAAPRRSVGEDEVGGEVWKVEVPLHGRYQVPSDSGINVIHLFESSETGEAKRKTLRAGWTCEPLSLKEGLDGMSLSPILTGDYDCKVNGRLLGGSTEKPKMLALIPPGHVQLRDVYLPAATLAEPVHLTLPTGHPSHQLTVEIITSLAIWIGWAYLGQKMWNVYARRKAQLAQTVERLPASAKSTSKG